MIRLDTLRVKGFKNLNIKNLSFPPEGNILITGQNESGKSSVFEAIFFALTSDLLVRDKSGYTDAIAFDQNAAEIELSFYKDQIPAQIRKVITRTHQGGSSLDIDFTINGVPQTGTNTELGDKIEKFVEFDADVLRNSCFVKQKELEGDFEQGIGKRKKIIGKLLNLENLSVLRENYKIDSKNKEIVHNYYKNRNIIENNDRELEKISEELQIIEDRKQDYEIVRHQMQKINNLIQNLKSLEKKITEDSIEIKKIEKEIKEIEEKVEDVKKLRTISKEKDAITHMIEKEKINRDKTQSELKNSQKEQKTLEELIKKIEEKQEALENFKKQIIEAKKEEEKLLQLLKKQENYKNIKNEMQLAQVNVEKYKDKQESLLKNIDNAQTNIKAKLKNKIEETKAKLNEYNSKDKILTDIKVQDTQTEIPDKESRKKYSVLIKTSPIYGGLIVIGIILAFLVHIASLSLTAVGFLLGILILLGEFDKGPLKNLIKPKDRSSKAPIPIAYLESIENEIHKLKSDIENNLNHLGISSDFEDSTILDALDIFNSSKVIVPNTSNIKELQILDYQNIPLISDLLFNLDKETEELEQNNKIYSEINNQIQKFSKLLEENKNLLPEKYILDEKLLDKESKLINSKIASIQTSEKNSEAFLKNNPIKEKIPELNQIKEDIKSLVTSIKETDSRIDELSKKEVELEQRIPKEYRDKNLNEVHEKLMKEITRLSQNQSDIKTENKTNWNNFSKSTNSFYSEEFIATEFKIPPEILENQNFPKISDFIHKSKAKIVNIEQDLKKDLLKRIPQDSSDNFDLNLTEFVKKNQSKIGVLRDEIDKAKKSVANAEKSKKTRKLIEDYENLKGNIQQKLERVTQEVSILTTAELILSEGEVELSQKVIPKTMDNLTKILPILTADRYKDAEITTDYKIKIFDSKKMGYVRKVLLSGGTNDQIALAFRLAFAIATMHESDQNESFIFLDEPLGFFDDERRSALIDFLTHGLIADKFAQRIVISNYLEIKPYFDYVIELANGTIISENVTGSLDTTQFEQDYSSVGDYHILEFSQKKDGYKEEEDYCVIQMVLKNTSEYVITNVKIEKPEIDINLSTKYLSKLAPNEERNLEIGFRKIVLEEADLNLEAHFKLHQSDKEFILSKQYIQIKPKPTK